MISHHRQADYGALATQVCSHATMRKRMNAVTQPDTEKTPLNGAHNPVSATPSTKPREQIVELLVKEGLIDETQLRYAMRVQTRLETTKSLLSVLQELNLVRPEQVRQAVRTNPQFMRLGDLLIELGHLREADLRAALANQAAATEKRKLGEILVESHMITEQKLTDVLSDLLGLPAVEPRVSEIDGTLLARINSRWCIENSFIPLEYRDDKVVVAFADPLDLAHRKAAEQMLGAAIIPAIARRAAIREAL